MAHIPRHKTLGIKQWCNPKWAASANDLATNPQIRQLAPGRSQNMRQKLLGLTKRCILPRTFLSILSIKCGNWFYWADRAETADRAESTESTVFMRILAYVAGNQ
jgi:hypothetical protein